MLTTEFDVFALREAVRAVKRFAGANAWKGYIDRPFGGLASTSDADIDAYVRVQSTTVFHPVGTASMTAKGKSWGVVDPDLKLKGAEGVRIVDASIWVSDAGWVYTSCANDTRSSLLSPMRTPRAPSTSSLRRLLPPSSSRAANCQGRPARLVLAAHWRHIHLLNGLELCIPVFIVSTQYYFRVPAPIFVQARVHLASQLVRYPRSGGRCCNFARPRPHCTCQNPLTATSISPTVFLCFGNAIPLLQPKDSYHHPGRSQPSGRIGSLSSSPSR